jgi:sugar O-acyltransferase (sialic acid O-acetyltransferase NeuD family)
MVTDESILLIGAGGHARASIDVIEQSARYSVAGLIGLPHEVGSEVFGYSILGTNADLLVLSKKYRRALVTIGQIKTPEPRIKSFNLLVESGYNLPVIISPNAYVSPHAKIGAGTLIMHGAVVNAGAVIGLNCIINSHALIEHDAIIGDHCHISTAAVINGAVVVGSMTFIGSNTCVRNDIQIGDRCVIGMGQRIHVDCVAESCLPVIKETQ